MSDAVELFAVPAFLVSVFAVAAVDAARGSSAAVIIAATQPGQRILWFGIWFVGIG